MKKLVLGLMFVLVLSSMVVAAPDATLSSVDSIYGNTSRKVAVKYIAQTTSPDATAWIANGGMTPVVYSIIISAPSNVAVTIKDNATTPNTLAVVRCLANSSQVVNLALPLIGTASDATTPSAGFKIGLSGDIATDITLIGREER